MITDHTKAGETLKTTLAHAGLGITPPQALDEVHREAMGKLEAVSGPEFDRLYVSMQIEAHQQALALFGNYATEGDNPELKVFAGELLPTLHHHYEMIEKIAQSS